MNNNVLLKLSLTKRILLLTILIGISVFFITDIYIEKEVVNSFQSELGKKLQQQSILGRANLNHAIKSHYQLTKVIASQHSFHEYLNGLLLHGKSNEVLNGTKHRRTPSWLPKRSVLRSLGQAKYYILYDSKASMLEFYTPGLEPIPKELLSPETNFLRASHNENFISSIAGLPHIVSAEQVPMAGRSFTLLLATPIDDAFLMRLLPSFSDDQVVILSSGMEPYVIASSNTNAIPKGVKVNTLQNEYLIFGEKVYNYEVADLLVTYSHLLPKSLVFELARPIIKKQRLQHALTGGALIFFFTFAMLWMSKRIHSLTKKVSNFSETTLGMEPHGEFIGDEITILDNEFRFLTEEVIATTRKQASLLDSVLRAIPTSIYYMSKDGEVIGCNDAFAQLLDSPKKEIIGKKLEELFNDEDTAISFFPPERERKAVKEGLVLPQQASCLEIAGKQYDVVIHRSAFEKGDGDIGGFVGAITDVSEITKVRDELISAHSLLKSLINSIPDPIFYKDKAGSYLGCNKAFSEFTNKSENEIVGHTDNDLFINYPADFFRRKDQKILDHGSLRRSNEWVDYPDGRKVLFDTLETPFYGLAGEVRGMIGISRDITEQFLANEKIQAESARFQNVLDSFDALIYVADMKTYELLFINKFGKDIWGDIIGETCWQKLQIGQSGPCPFCTNSKLLNEDGKPTGVCVWEFHNTSTNDWFECRDQAILWPDGRYVRLEIATKINERKKSELLQERLQQSQKMESIGTLAGGIAHDFNNILSAILGFTELAMMDIDNQQKLENDLNEVLKGAERAKELVKQILTFGRKTNQNIQPVRMHIIVKEVLKLLRSSIPTTIDIKQDVDTNCPAILADSTQIHQIIMNLCTNSYHAMRDQGGVLKISLQAVTVQQLDIEKNRLALEKGPYVKFSVSDTGIGMTPDVIEKIFDPYFTTKEKGEGTGLGLAVVHGIITSLHGDISVISELGKGSVFNVYIPAIEEVFEPQSKEESAAMPTGQEHVFIVDDDKVLVQLLTRMLEKQGYKVTAFSDSSEALSVFMDKPSEFDLVISDMTMPKITGADLARRILDIRSDIPVILCTGFSELVNEEKAKAIGVSALLMKPVSAKDLLAKVRTILDS